MKWTYALFNGQPVLMYDNMISSISMDEVCEKLNLVSALMKENENLKEDKKNLYSIHSDMSAEISALTEQMENLQRDYNNAKELNRTLHEANERQAVVISEFKQEGSSERARANNAVGKYWDTLQENERLREERKEIVEAIRKRYEHSKWLKDVNTTPPSIINEIEFLESLLSKFPE